MISLRSTTCRPPCAARRSHAPRRTLAPAHAGGGLGEALNSIGEGFMRIFSPPKDQAPNGNWTGTSSTFTGRIDHSGQRPFKDGFTAVKGAAEKAGSAAKATASDAAAAAEDAAAAIDQTAQGEAGYLEGAVKGVMGKNFAGKEDADRPTTGSEGWKGDIHTRGRDGFHAPRN